MTGPVRAVTIAAVILLFCALGRADLFNPDEPREAEIAREMWVSGDLVVPRLNGEAFLEKPPLFYWLVVASYRLAGGPSELAARAVPALAGLFTVLLTWGFGRRLVGPTGALLGSGALLTSLQFLWTARRCMIDVPLTLAILVACSALHRSLDAERGRRALWLWLGHLATGAAVLLKGIVGAGIPVLAIGGFLAARRDWGGLRRCALIPGTIAALLPAALWTMMLHLRLGPEGVREFVWVNNVLRFLGGASKGHVQPFWYYLPTFFTDFAPWSLLAPFAVAASLVMIRRGGRAPADGETMAAGHLISWVLVPLVVLSIASTKRGIYLLPLYPAAALLVGAWIARLTTRPTSTLSDAASDPRAVAGGWEPPRPSWPARAALGLLFGATIVVAALLPAALRLVLPEARLAAWVSLGVPLLAAVAGSTALRASRPDRLALVTIGTVGVVHLVLASTVVPRIVNGSLSPRMAAHQVRRMIDAGDRLALYRFKEGSLGGYLFYSGATLPHLRDTEELRRHFMSGAVADSSPRSLALMREEVYAGLAADLGIPTTVVRRFPAGPQFLPSGALLPGTMSSSSPGALPAPPGDAVVLVAADPIAPAGDRSGPPAHEVSDSGEPADG
jgi:4-amino-4-deoxy-L-arabinose transferase-like glycosyltransferase